LAHSINDTKFDDANIAVEFGTRC